MLGNLRLRHWEVAHDRADRLLAGDQHVQDVTSVDVGNCVEDVGCCRCADHPLNIF